MYTVKEKIITSTPFVLKLNEGAKKHLTDLFLKYDRNNIGVDEMSRKISHSIRGEDKYVENRKKVRITKKQILENLNTFNAIFKFVCGVVASKEVTKKAALKTKVKKRFPKCVIYEYNMDQIILYADGTGKCKWVDFVNLFKES